MTLKELMENRQFETIVSILQDSPDHLLLDHKQRLYRLMAINHCASAGQLYKLDALEQWADYWYLSGWEAFKDKVQKPREELRKQFLTKLDSLREKRLRELQNFANSEEIKILREKTQKAVDDHKEQFKELKELCDARRDAATHIEGEIAELRIEYTVLLKEFKKRDNLYDEEKKNNCEQSLKDITEKISQKKAEVVTLYASEIKKAEEKLLSMQKQCEKCLQELRRMNEQLELKRAYYSNLCQEIQKQKDAVCAGVFTNATALLKRENYGTV